MQYSGGLISATLLKRYKRFLADVQLNDRVITVHCANTGRMTGCGQPGDTVWLWDSANPKRKLPLSWEWSEVAGQRMCINTARMNALVKEALLAGHLPEVCNEPIAPSALTPEPVIEGGSASGRLDFYIEGSAYRPSLFIEVKSVTLLLNEQGDGAFPDAPTTRGLKHVQALCEKVAQGHRAILLFVVAHEGIERVQLADEIDPVYAEAVRDALNCGVEVLAYRVLFTHNDTGAGMQLIQSIPFQTEQ